MKKKVTGSVEIYLPSGEVVTYTEGEEDATSLRTNSIIVGYTPSSVTVRQSRTDEQGNVVSESKTEYLNIPFSYKHLTEQVEGEV